jgi:hypothetical protein
VKGSFVGLGSRLVDGVVVPASRTATLVGASVEVATLRAGEHTMVLVAID